MTFLRVLCILGLHPCRGWRFIGAGYNHTAYVTVCLECGKQQR